MTLGQRIAALRKEKGLSQEGLGELVGVSRQAVSKWEADKTVPDVNNCIAMSRVFGISLAGLLEVEEPLGDGAERTGGEQLSEEQLAMVEAVVTRYLEKRKRRIRPGPLILGGILVLTVVLLPAWEWLTQLERRMSSISQEMEELEWKIVSGVGDKVTATLEAESSLVTDWSCILSAVDLAANTATYDIAVTMKEVGEDTTVSFLARSGGEQVTVTGAREEQVFTARLICPLSDDIQIYLVADSAGVSRTQQLYTDMRLAERYSVRLGGTVTSTWLSENGLTEDASEMANVTVDCSDSYNVGTRAEVVRLEVGVLVGEKLVKTIPVDTEEGGIVVEPNWSLSTYVNVPLGDVSAKAGDTLAIVLFSEDNAGRRTSHILGYYRIGEEGAAEPDLLKISELDDGTWGLEARE